MAETLLFITGVLTGIIVGFLFARRTRGSSAPNGSSERLLEERLSKADAGLEQFSRQLEAQNEELKSQQKQLQEAREAAATTGHRHAAHRPWRQTAPQVRRDRQQNSDHGELQLVAFRSTHQR